MKKIKFDYNERANALLDRFGAQPGGLYKKVLPTMAGPMHCAVYDNWTARKFDYRHIERAASVVTGDPSVGLSPISGKWNRHGNNPPTQQDLTDLFTDYARICPLPAAAQALFNGCSSTLREGLGGPPQALHLSYMYRDADNYKTSGDAYIALANAGEQELRQLLWSMDINDATLSFIPGQLGLSDLQDGRWDEDCDHPWHEVTSMAIRPLDESPALELLDMPQVATRAKQIVAVLGWDEMWRPGWNEAMLERQGKCLSQMQNLQNRRERAS